MPLARTWQGKPSCVEGRQVYLTKIALSAQTHMVLPRDVATMDMQQVPKAELFQASQSLAAAKPTRAVNKHRQRLVECADLGMEGFVCKRNIRSIWQGTLAKCVCRTDINHLGLGVCLQPGFGFLSREVLTALREKSSVPDRLENIPTSYDRAQHEAKPEHVQRPFRCLERCACSSRSLVHMISQSWEIAGSEMEQRVASPSRRVAIIPACFKIERCFETLA
jgi:hypothetical protein